MASVFRFLARRPWISAVVLVAVVGLSVGGYFVISPGAKATPAATYRLVAATTGTVRQSISSTGTVAPAVQDALSFGVSGQVTKVAVTAGQKVSTGTVLATINSASLAASLAQAQAALATDQAKVTTDTNNGATSTQIAADNAAVTAAQGQVVSARASLNAATLTSPIGGLVASVGLTVGQQVSGSGASSSANSSASSGSSGSGGFGGTGSGSSGSGSGSGSGTGTGSSGSSGSSSSTSSADILVISTTSWIVNASIDDTQVGSIAPGDQAQMIVDGATGTVYGTVSSVGLVPSSASGVASYPVVVAVTGNPAGLHDGASATVSLIFKQLGNVLVVPTSAVHVASGKQVVYEIANGKQVAHDVTIGMSSGGSSQVLSGLASGTEVVVPIIRRATGTSTRTGRTGGGGGGFGGSGTGTGTSRTTTGG